MARRTIRRRRRTHRRRGGTTMRDVFSNAYRRTKSAGESVWKYMTKSKTKVLPEAEKNSLTMHSQHIISALIKMNTGDALTKEELQLKDKFPGVFKYAKDHGMCTNKSDCLALLLHYEENAKPGLVLDILNEHKDLLKKLVVLSPSELTQWRNVEENEWNDLPEIVKEFVYYARERNNPFDHSLGSNMFTFNNLKLQLPQPKPTDYEI